MEIILVLIQGSILNLLFQFNFCQLYNSLVLCCISTLWTFRKKPTFIAGVMCLHPLLFSAVSIIDSKSCLHNMVFSAVSTVDSGSCLHHVVFWTTSFIGCILCLHLAVVSSLSTARLVMCWTCMLNVDLDRSTSDDVLLLVLTSLTIQVSADCNLMAVSKRSWIWSLNHKNKVNFLAR